MDTDWPRGWHADRHEIRRAIGVVMTGRRGQRGLRSDPEAAVGALAGELHGARPPPAQRPGHLLHEGGRRGLARRGAPEDRGRRLGAAEAAGAARAAAGARDLRRLRHDVGRDARHQAEDPGGVRAHPVEVPPAGVRRSAARRDQVARRPCVVGVDGPRNPDGPGPRLRGAQGGDEHRRRRRPHRRQPLPHPWRLERAASEGRPAGDGRGAGGHRRGDARPLPGAGAPRRLVRAAVGGDARAPPSGRRPRQRDRSGRARRLAGPWPSRRRHAEVRCRHPDRGDPAPRRAGARAPPRGVRRPLGPTRCCSRRPTGSRASSRRASTSTGRRRGLRPVDRTSGSTTSATPARRWRRWPAPPSPSSSSASATAASTPPSATSTPPRAATGRSPRRSRGCRTRRASSGSVTARWGRGPSSGPRRPGRGG